MKKLTLLSLLLLVLTACNQSAVTSETTTEETPNTPTETVAEESFYYWPSEGQRQVIYEIQTPKSEAIKLEYPQIVNLTEGHPLVAAMNPKYKSVAVEIQTDAENFSREMTEKDGYSPMTWDYSVGWLGGRYHKDLWSLAMQVYTYTGGAHGNHWVDTYNFHKPTNRVLALEDLFTNPTAWDVLSEAIMEQIIVAKTERYQASGQGEYNPEEDGFVSDLTMDEETLSSWLVSEENGTTGLSFNFAPYAIGAYAEGEYQVFVPLSVFSEYLKDEYRTAFE